jgi:hypothetical protein
MPTTSAPSDWLTPPPAPDAELGAWQAWKHEIMTASHGALLRRNPWFTFRKEEIFEQLGGTLPVVPLLYSSRRDGPRRFSSLVESLDLAALGHKLVLKGSLGHSNQQVKVLDLAKWPERAKCLLHKVRHTPAALDAWAEGRPFLIEPAISAPSEPICADFKVYVRRGRSRVVLIVDRNREKPRIAFVDCGSWLQIPLSDAFASLPPRYEDRGRLDDRMVARARRAATFAPEVARAIDAEDLFLAVDTYVPKDAPDRVWLGEITPRPGGLDGNWLRRRFLQYLFLSEPR